MSDIIVFEEGLSEDVENVIIASPLATHFLINVLINLFLFQPEYVTDNETRKIHSKLYRAALKDEWDIAEGIFKEHPDCVLGKISAEGNTALHIAAASAHTTFGIKLVEKMRTEDLLTTNNAGNTAFCLAAASGNVKLAKKMLEKNINLALIQGGNSEFPVYMAALNRHKEMVSYLYKATVDHLSREDLIELLITLIKTSFFDIALQLVEKHPKIATERDKNAQTALHSLAQMPLIFYYRGIVVEFLLPRVVEILKMPPQALKLVQLLWKQVMLLSDNEIILEIIRKLWSLIFAAAKQGNSEFLNIIFYDFLDLILEADENSYSIFHLAVQYRHANVFKLIYEIGALKDSVIKSKDKKGNTILHLAAMLSPPDRLDAVAVSFFKLRMEILWFLEVNRILPETVAEVKNEDGKTAEVLFTEQHIELREAGKKWIKDTMNSGLVMATIITTMTFAAVFTVPGGTQQDQGTPNLVGDFPFVCFAIMDAISLLSSSCSILFFLALFRLSLGFRNFFLALPLWLCVAFVALYASVFEVLVAFNSAIFILFKDGMPWIPAMVSFFIVMIVAIFMVRPLPFLIQIFIFLFRGSNLQPQDDIFFWITNELTEPKNGNKKNT